MAKNKTDIEKAFESLLLFEGEEPDEGIEVEGSLFDTPADEEDSVEGWLEGDEELEDALEEDGWEDDDDDACECDDEDCEACCCCDDCDCEDDDCNESCSCTFDGLFEGAELQMPDTVSYYLEARKHVREDDLEAFDETGLAKDAAGDAFEGIISLLDNIPVYDLISLYASLVEMAEEDAKDEDEEGLDF